MIEFKLSDTITVKPLEIDEANYLYDFVERNKEHLINWIPFVSKVKGIEDVNEYVKGYIEKRKNDMGLLFGIWDNKLLIGTILIRETDKEAKWAEIGYMIDEKYQRKGITKKACIKLIDNIFDVMLLEKVEICCDDENMGSIRLAESLGFILEGTIRNHFVVNNRNGNMRYYGLLKKERIV
jgi:ribosomal-protein-serine acetyltransferase